MWAPPVEVVNVAEIGSVRAGLPQRFLKKKASKQKKQAALKVLNIGHKPNAEERAIAKQMAKMRLQGVREVEAEYDEEIVEP